MHKGIADHKGPRLQHLDYFIGHRKILTLPRLCMTVNKGWKYQNLGKFKHRTSANTSSPVGV